MKILKASSAQHLVRFAFAVLVLIAGYAAISLAGAALLSGGSAQAQNGYIGGQTSILPNFSYSAQTFTATGVTGSVQGISGVNAGSILVKGVGLTTVTWAIQGSQDGGLDWFPLSTALYTAPGTLAQTQTTTSTQLYLVNLATYTNFRIVTSGTFTATSVAFKVTASANKGLL